ncbi:MAG: threonine synthase [Fidelibacterota bacterium]
MSQPYHIGYICMSCGELYPVDPFRYTCQTCGSNLDIAFEYALIAAQWSQRALEKNKNHSMWRYRPLLPVKGKPEEGVIPVGGTPLLQQKRLAQELGLRDLWLKDDTRNPSGSLKDRATDLAIQHAREEGYTTLVAASTGNAAASLACLSAASGMEAVIFVPAEAPSAKLTQILQYGAHLFPVEGTYDDAYDLSLKVVADNDWYSRSTGMNPVLSEGKKTVALEIAEQMNWVLPDYVFVPVGDGCIIGGVFKGFFDLHQLGWIERIPRIIAVQAKGSSAIINALEQEIINPVMADTIADSISVAMPRDGLKALRAVKESQGFGILVSDSEILSAQHFLARTTGLFAEPAAATAFAGLLKAESTGRIGSNDSVAVLITGSGLKDISAAQKGIKFPKTISPTVTAFHKAWKQSHG